MGNFIAGFEGAVYDRNYFFTTGGGNAEAAVLGAGLVYHMSGNTMATNDPFDRTGIPDILSGAQFGWRYSGLGTGCTY
jgi:hypothetical protein